MNTNRETLRIYWQHARNYKRNLRIIYPMMFTAQLFEDFLSPLLIAGVLNKLSAGDLESLQIANIWYVFVGVILLELIAHSMWNVLIRIFWRTQDRIMVDLNMTAFDHLQKMSMRFFSDRFAGSIVNQVNKFVASFERLTDALTWNVFKLIVSLFLTTVILAPRAPIISIVILLIAAIYVPVVWYFRRKQVPYTTKWSESETRRTGQLADTVTNIMAVKSFSNEQLERDRMLIRVYDVHDRSIDTMRINMTQELGTGAIQRSINLAVIVLSIILAVNGVVVVGTIYLALTYTLGIMRRLWDLNNTFRTLTRVFGDSSEMTKILAIEPEIKEPQRPKPFKARDGAVVFNNVTFSYPDSEEGEKLFNNLDLSIQPGEKIGLIGRSGGGKTTITKLLLRFMDIDDGDIEIDGQNITESRQSDVRDAISYVPQEPLLFHRTLHENIAYGKHDATPKDVIKAAKKANAHTFIEQLDDGYETLVGERGVKLSGGQKQRVAIARAMLKDSPILVLDEATSALDSESEQLIQDALWKLMEGKTAIVIAHRLSTIQKMDRIIVLDEGKIVEEGTHKQLHKKKNGVYAKLWAHQSGGFLQD